jgi:CSLREA domain-containing protein
MKKYFHFFMLLSVLLPLVNPSAAYAAARPARASLTGRTDSAGATQPLLPPGFFSPTSIQAPAWTGRVLHNPTWRSASESSTALYTLQGAGSPDSASPAAAIPDAPQDLGDWSNTAAAACIFSLGPILNFDFTLSLLIKPPPLDLPPAFGAYLADLGLKFCAPILYAPTDIVIQNPPTCKVTFDQSRMAGKYANLYGFPSPFSELQPWSDWGDLGTPLVQHWNTQVAVSSNTDGVSSAAGMTFPTGVHLVTWRGDTLIHPLDYIFIYIPGLGEGREVLEKALKATKFLGNLVLRQLISATPNPVGIYNEEPQYVTVTDTVPPQMSLRANNVQVEAIEPGGVSRDTYLNALKPTVQLSDNCDPSPDLTALNPPAFAVTGQSYTITWQGSDRGPLSPSGGVNSVTRQQTFTVVDTLAPIIQAPPDVVTESASSPALVSIGAPATFDLADFNPIVTNNACSLPGVDCSGGTTRFPTGKTTVTWTATDHSGNASQATQLVNVKAVGSNHAPSALGLAGGTPAAISYEPITLTLTAQDPDQDPLWFKIGQPPANGFFHSPLYPYFIQDYRLANVNNINFTTYCNDPSHHSTYIPTNWPVKADFMAVADDGTLFVHDNGMVFCGGVGDLHQDYRLAIFHPDGSWTQVADSFDTKDIYVDWRNQRIYTTSTDVGSSFTWVRRYDLDLHLVDQFRIDYADYPINSPHQGVMDDQGLIYVTNGFQYAGATQLYIYDTQAGTHLKRVGDYTISGKNWMDLALDSQDNLYASEKNSSRVYKFSPALRNADGSVTPGALIGWLGKCDAGPGCDIAHQRSFGYSCADATCTLNSGDTPNGALPGQLDFPRGIAMDLNDILYVTDYNNLRVQRFTPEGYFAGQAKSQCDGTCFTLGDFGHPKQVTVNSNNFYILDANADLLHVFETTPLTRVDDHTAQIVYQSRNNFVGTDTFTYQVTDGLANSAPAAVAVNVSRNYRPPQADRGLSFSGTEDIPLPVTLSGYDPDGSLDTLTYQVVQRPAHGSVQGVEPNRVYIPNSDYNGQDTFTFAAYDGKFLSAPQTVTVTLAAVNDAPRFPAGGSNYAVHLAGSFFDASRLAALDSLTVGRGYDTMFNVNFYDPDIPDLHTATIDWGDGSPLEKEGKRQPDGSVNGLLVTEGIHGGQGEVSSKHIYAQDGSYPAKVCVTDNMSVDGNGNKTTTPASVTACHTIQATVQTMTDLLVHFDHASQLAVQGADITYTLGIVNHPPDSGAALDATGIKLDGAFDPRLLLKSITPSQGTCSLTSPGSPSAAGFTCSLGTLAAGSSASIQVGAHPDASIAIGDVLQNSLSYSLDQANQASQPESYGTTTILTPADFIVDSTQDMPDASPGSGGCADSGGYCTLRAAIEEANAEPGAQTIALSDQTYQISTTLVINQDLTITGLGADRTVVGGSGSDRLLSINGGAKVSLSNLTLTGGDTTSQGGGIYLQQGSLTLQGMQINDNHAGGAGGGIWVGDGSSLTVSDSSITGNSSDLGAGGIYNLGTLSLQNTTVSGNQGESGGGIASSGPAQLLNVTIAGNQATNTGGGLSGTSSFSLKNTLLAGNSAPHGPDCAPDISSQGYNLLGDATGCTVSGAKASDHIGVSAHLDGLALDGATTFTNAIGGGSPALDTGACDLPADQRGVPRPQDGNLDGNPKCDIGAFELVPSSTYLPLVR